MKLICSKESLIEGINIVQKAVSSKTTMPILEGILLEAGDSFKLTGNDLEIGIECYVDADIKQTGSIVINSKMFGDIVRRLPESEILIEVKENNMVVIECENSYFEVKGLQSSGFPSILEIERENAFKISQKLVRDMIKQTIFAVSVEESRPILTGSLIECKNNEISFVSIDGFRLALRKNKIESDHRDFNTVVPGKTLNEIVKILQPVDEEISIFISNNQVMFDMGRCRVVSRLLEGEYLNYRGIIPVDHETKIRVNTKELLLSIERASLISADEKRYPVKFSITDEKMIISSSTEIGNSREELRVETAGKELEIGFNPRYFIEALRVIEDEFIEIYFTTSMGPCIIRPEEKDVRYEYLVVPIRMKKD